MKRFTFLSRFLSVIAVVLLIAGCSDKKGSIFTSIPADSKLVSVVNLKTMMDKGKFDDITQFGIFEKMYPKMESEDKEIAEFVKSICQDPEKTGIDLTGKMIVFVNGESLERPEAGLIVGLADAAKFEDFISEVIGKADETFEINDEGTYKSLVVGEEKQDNFDFSWSNDRLIIHGSASEEDVKSKTAKLYEQKAGESLLSNSDFDDFADQKADHGVWISYGDLMKSLPGELSMMNQFTFFDFTDTYLHLITNFKKGEVVSESKMNFGPKMKDMLEKYAPVKDKIDSKVLDYLPKKSLLALSVGLDLPKAIEFVKSQPMFAAQFEEASKAVAMMAKGKGLEEIINTFGGDIAISVSDVKMIEVEKYGRMSEQPMPEVTICISLNDKSFIDEMKKMAPPELLKEENGILSFDYEGNTVYGVLTDDVLVVTTGKKIAEKAVNGGYGNDGLSKGGIRDLAEDASSLIYVNLSVKDLPEDVKKMLSAQTGGMYDNISEALEIFDNMVISSKSYKEGQMILKLSSDDENSLYTIINTFSETATKLPL